LKLDPHPSFFSLWFSRPILKRASIVSVIVGTLLIAINQGDLILSGGMPPLWKIILTYMVPYSVSSFSSVLAQRSFEKLLSEQKKQE